MSARRIVIVAGRKSHGPADNGIHDYPAQARLLQWGLQKAYGDAVVVTRAEDDTWPSAAIAAADTLVIISDGRDGDQPYAEASHLASPERIAEVEAAAARGMGVVVIHFATFAAERDAERVLRWQGAHFAWEKDGKRAWSSRITWATGVLEHATPGHAVLRGVSSGPLREEFYHALAFHPHAVPLIRVRALPGEQDAERNVAWAIERPDGGRGFGTSMVHSLDSLRHDGLRTLVLNGIAWSARLEIPEGGLRVPYAEREDVAVGLGICAAPGPIRVAVLAGNAAHRWHHWPETTGALLHAWAEDPRISTRVYTDPLDLVTGLGDRDVLVLNWVNWEDPLGLAPTVRRAIEDFVARGGGVFIHHFANGACHVSLPHAAASDWPWYRTLVRRIWDHRVVDGYTSTHDRFRSFSVRVAQGDHPLVAGLNDFSVEDELYWRQRGDEPIQSLLVARSEESGADEPLAWTYEVGAGRVVQSLLGHSAKTYDAPAMRVFARRAVAWCARRAVHGAGC